MKIGFIGIGNMNSAIVDGLLNSGYDSSKINLNNRTMEKIEKYRQYGVNLYNDSQELIDNSDIIILGLKPYMYPQWLDAHDISRVKFISIGAGITSEFMSKYTKDFVLTMPNTPSKVGCGSTLIIESTCVTEDVLGIFKSFGGIKVIREDELAKYTLVTGSSPAYFFTFVDSMCKVFEQDYGIDYQTSQTLLAQVMEGASKMLREDKLADVLCDNVCSPGGITIEVVKALQETMEDSVRTGFERAMIRTEEMKEE